MADGINYQTPTVTSLDIKVYGDMNNISVAAAIYNWYKEYSKEHCRIIELSTITNLLMDQAKYDARMGLWTQAMMKVRDEDYEEEDEEE